LKEFEYIFGIEKEEKPCGAKHGEMDREAIGSEIEDRRSTL